MPEDATVDLVVARHAVGPGALGVDELDRPLPHAGPRSLIAEHCKDAFGE